MGVIFGVIAPRRAAPCIENARAIAAASTRYDTLFRERKNTKS